MAIATHRTAIIIGIMLALAFLFIFALFNGNGWEPTIAGIRVPHAWMWGEANGSVRTALIRWG